MHTGRFASLSHSQALLNDLGTKLGMRYTTTVCKIKPGSGLGMRLTGVGLSCIKAVACMSTGIS